MASLPPFIFSYFVCRLDNFVKTHQLLNKPNYSDKYLYILRLFFILLKEQKKKEYLYHNKKIIQEKQIKKHAFEGQ